MLLFNHCSGGLYARRASSWLGRLCLFVVLLSPVSAGAYQVGDKVDEAILKALAVDPEKLTIVDFFASWCASCKKEIPLLDAMPIDAEKAELLGVCTDKDVKKGQAFQQDLNIQFRVYDDVKQDVVAAFAPFGMPAIYYVQHGVVKQVRFGAIPRIDQVVEKDIRALLEGSQ